MGLSASQARFLQLTARRGDIEYEVQQINFQRLLLSEKMSAASTKYQDAMNNRKLTFSFNSGEGMQEVDISYTNYKNYMNQQLEGLMTTQQKYYLVSSSGNKLVVSSEAERNEIIENNKTRIALSEIENAKKEVETAQAAKDAGEDYTEPSEYTKSLAGKDLSNATKEIVRDENGNETEYYTFSEYTEKDFVIADDLDNVETFQNALKEGIYYFATRNLNQETNKYEFNVKGIDTLGGGAISEVYDTSDDAAAQAEYESVQNKVQSLDKKLELKLDQLETERNAITTEMDSVKKVVEDNIEKTFNIFS